jgi:uncharacterized protein (TIGR02266 family)
MKTGDSKHILLADDSIFFRTKLSDILKEAGHRVTLASDGQEVIEKLKEDLDPPDLLILDLQMPHVNGFGVLEWMDEHGFKGLFPVMVVTSFYEPGEVEIRLEDFGVCGFMKKGFTPEQVIYQVNRLLFPKKGDEKEKDEPRVPVSIPVDYTLEGTTQTGFLLNVSASGLFLHTTEELRPGHVVRLKFSLPGSEKVYDIEGIVTRPTTTGAPSLFCGVGIMFVSISDEEREELRHFVDNEITRLTPH